MEWTAERIENVYRAWPRFDADGEARRSGNLPNIDLLRLSLPYLWGADRGNYVLMAARALQSLLYRGNIYADGFDAVLFLTEGTWQPNNRIIRYKKTWKMISQFESLGNLRPGAEVLIESLLGLRFASVAAVNPSSFSVAFRLISSSSYCGLITLTREPDFLGEDFAREMYRLSFPITPEQGGRFNIGNVCSSRCAQGDLIVDCGFETDDSCFLIDIFGPPRTMKAVEGMISSIRR
jgi:hypothetical protein